MGLKKVISNIYIKWKVITFQIRKKLYGFANANVYLQTVDNRAIIPILKKNGAKIGEGCVFKSPLFIDNPKGSYKNLQLGKGISIGANTYIDLMDEVIIGDYTGVGPGVSFLTHWHVGDVPLKKLFPFKTDKIIIDENCFIGLDCTILYGTRLKEFTLIGARSLVKGTFPSGSLAEGNPAKVTSQLREKALAKLKN
jgi:acetyltransferase-like isoleucine patch superfamily enzyme